MMRRTLSLVAFLFLLATLLWLRFPDFATQGNQGVIEAWGDGYKSYHAYLYHIRYDATLTQFGGMNYPYGEHVIPADTQPLLSNGIKVLASWGIQLEPYAFGIFHAVLWLGWLLCGLFLWLIFTRLGLPVWYSTIVAIALTFLAPQLDRMESHFGLAHPELLPLVFYLLLRFHQQPHWRWSLALGAVVWAYSQIHFYYFAIVSFAIFGFMALRWLSRRDWAQTGSYLLHGSIQLLLPFSFFFFWLYYGDPITDRTAEPWGFFNYRAWLEGVFTSLSQPHWRWFDEHLISIRRIDMEGQSYVGLVALVYTLLVVSRLLRKRVLIPTAPQAQQEDQLTYIRLLLGTGLLVLLFSLGLPFIIPGGEKLLEWLSPIRQFRSIGRFAWVFYYAVNVAAFYELYQWMARDKKMRLFIGVLALGVLCFESLRYSQSHDLRLDTIEEMAPGQAFTDIDSLDFARYQAILPVPYYNIGSDNYWWSLSGFIGQKTQTLSLQTGLPLTGAMLTRTSLSQTVNQLQMVLEPYRTPALLQDLPSDKPLLMAWDEERLVGQRHLYEHLLSGARLVYAKPPLFLYELPLSAFEQHVKERHDQLYGQLTSGKLQARDGGWLTTDSLTQWHASSFDHNPSAKSYQGGGGFEGLLSENNVVLDMALTTDSTSNQVTVSCWMWMAADRYPRTDMVLLELDPQTGGERARHTKQSRELVVIFDNNGWALLEWSVPTAPAGSSRWQLSFQNEAIGQSTLWVDEVWLRPANKDVARRMPSGWVYNNRWW